MIIIFAIIWSLQKFYLQNISCVAYSDILNTRPDVSLASNTYINDFIQAINENSPFPNDCPSLHNFSNAW